MFKSFSVLGLSSGVSLGAVFYTISEITLDTSGPDLFHANRLIEGAGLGFDSAEPARKPGAPTARFKNSPMTMNRHGPSVPMAMASASSSSIQPRLLTNDQQFFRIKVTLIP
jgi:hypothetical protein